MSQAKGSRLMRLLAIGLVIAVIVFVVSAGHIIFLPLLFLPLGMFSLGPRRRRRTGFAKIPVPYQGDSPELRQVREPGSLDRALFFLARPARVSASAGVPSLRHRCDR